MEVSSSKSVVSFSSILLKFCKINLSDRSWGWWVPKINIVPGSDGYARVIYHGVHDDDDDDDDDVDDNIDDSEVICRGGESPDGGRRRVCRTESVKTQVNSYNQHDHDDSTDDHNNDDDDNGNDNEGYHDDDGNALSELATAPGREDGIAGRPPTKG